MSWTDEAYERAERARLQVEFDANNARAKIEEGMVYDIESEAMVHISQLQKPPVRLTVHSFENGVHETYRKEM
jgi:hypothetical protein